MKRKGKILSWARQITECVKDYRFNSILVKYFFLLLISLVIPMMALNLWYHSRVENNMQEELLAQNKNSMMVAYDNMSSVLESIENLAYNLSVRKEVQYLAILDSVHKDKINNLDSLDSMLSIIMSTNEYIESVAVYFERSGEVVSDEGIYKYSEYNDKACFHLYSEDMPGRATYEARKKEDRYPYLMTILYPIRNVGNTNYGAVAINIEVTKLGDYIGSGRYRNKENTPMLMIFDGDMNHMLYCDEYRLLIDEESESNELRQLKGWEDSFSAIYTLWGKNYAVSGIRSGQDDLCYLYLNSVDNFTSQNQEAVQIFRLGMLLILVVCLIVAVLLTFWIYHPIEKTVKVLKKSEMMIDWDKKERLDEIEAIQRSILLAKKEKEDLDSQIKERILSLHNAQICALQTQISPHFLFNTLTGIGNAAALLLGKTNVVTDMVFTLGKMMQISLSNKKYLVSLAEELEHVKLYMKLIDFRYREKISMHVEIPEEMLKEQIVKLTLQPLIENAIEHGLTQRHDKGNVWIKGVKEEEHLAIYVVDDGEGIEEKELYKLRARLKESAIGGSEHIGLGNVNQRLKLIFGDEYGLEINKSEKGGICVAVQFRTL